MCVFFFQLMGVVGVVVVIATAIPILTVAMIPVLGLCYYYAQRYLQVSFGDCCFPGVFYVFAGPLVMRPCNNLNVLK